MSSLAVRWLVAGMLALFATTSIHGQSKDKAVEKKTVAKDRLDRFGDPLPEGARLRLGTERFRTSSWSRAPIVMFPNGEYIVSVGSSHLTLFDAEMGYVVNRLRFENKGINDLAISPDGKRLVTVGLNQPGDGVLPVGALTVWDALALVELKTISWEERKYPEKVIVLPGNKVAATAESAGVCLWDLEGMEELPRLPTTGCSALAASPDGSLLAVADMRGTIHLWEWKKKIDSRKIERPRSRGAVSLAFSPDGKTLAAGFDFSDGITFFDVASGKMLRGLPRDASTYVTSMAFTPDGKQLITPDRANTVGRNENGGICVWDVETGKQARYIATPGEGPGSVSLSRDGSRLAAACGGAIRVWDTKTWKELAPDDTSHRNNVLSIATSENGLILTGSDDHSARLWDLKDGRLIHMFPSRYWVRNVALTPDGRKAAGLDTDDQILVWDTASGKTLFRLPGHERFGSHSMIIRDDGARLLSFGSDLFMRIVDLKNGKAIVEHAIRPQGIKIGDPEAEGFRSSLDMQMMMIGGGKFTPNGKLLLLSTLEELRVIETNSGKELRRLPGSRFGAFAISHDSQWLLTVQRPKRDPKGGAYPKDETVRMVKIEDGDNVGSMVFKDGSIRGIASSPDSKHFAVAVDKPEPQLHLCRIGDEKPLRSFKLSSPATSALAFTVDGKSLAVGVTGGSVLVFDVLVGKDK
jgi:WD40 repeat protein